MCVKFTHGGELRFRNECPGGFPNFQAYVEEAAAYCASL